MGRQKDAKYIFTLVHAVGLWNLLSIFNLKVRSIYTTCEYNEFIFLNWNNPTTAKEIVGDCLVTTINGSSIEWIPYIFCWSLFQNQWLVHNCRCCCTWLNIDRRKDTSTKNPVKLWIYRKTARSYYSWQKAKCW